MIYEIVPGVLLATIAMVVVSLATKPKPGVAEEFDTAVAVTDYAFAHPEANFHESLEAVEHKK